MSKLPKDAYETKEHIIKWIKLLKCDIADIDVESPEYNYNQAQEAVMKLELYLAKLEALNDDRIDLQDATELMINIYNLLDPKEYEDNIKTLQLRRYLCTRK